MTEPNATVTKPLYATIGAGDALYAAVNELVDKVRERATSADVTGRVEEARERLSNLPADVQEQFETLRTRITGLPSELPEDLAELRDRLTADELRKLVDQYYHQLVELYSDLAVRGEETVDRLRSANSTFEERFEQVESVYNDAVALGQDAYDKAYGQVRGLLGQVAEDAESVVEAEVVHVTSESEPSGNGPAKKAAPAAKKAAPAKKAPAKKATTTAKKS